MTARSAVRFSVDLDELRTKVDEMAAFEASIEEALHHAERVVSQLHVTWTGQAALAHAEAHHQWAAGLAEMREGLACVRAAAERAHGNYSGRHPGQRRHVVRGAVTGPR